MDTDLSVGEPFTVIVHSWMKAEDRDSSVINTKEYSQPERLELYSAYRNIYAYVLSCENYYKCCNMHMKIFY